MYSFLEIETFFRNCNTWAELDRCCKAFLFVMFEGDLSRDKVDFIREKSLERVEQLDQM